MLYTLAPHIAGCTTMRPTATGRLMCSCNCAASNTDAPSPPSFSASPLALSSTEQITAKLGIGELGLAFADAMNLLGTVLGAAVALHSAQPALAAVGLSISWGRDKTEVDFAPAEDGAVIRE